MADIIVLTLDDPVDASLSSINSNFAALNTELGNHQHSASAITSGVLAAARLGSGTASAATFLRGDQQWASVAPSDLASGGAAAGNLLRWDGAAWTASPLLTVDASGWVAIRAPASQIKRLDLGVDTGSGSVMHGFIQAVEDGVSYRVLALQPMGGGVAIGYTPTVPATNTLEIRQRAGEYAAIQTVNASGNRAIIIGHYPVHGDNFNDITGAGGDLRLYAEGHLLHMRSGMRLARYTSAPPLSGLSSNGDCALYMKDSKLVVAYNDGGTMRYKYLDLAGTGVTWQHSTTAP